MRVSCPQCQLSSDGSAEHPKIVRSGHFYRRSTSQWIQRYQCRGCGKHFSRATFHPCYRQKKRHKNDLLRRLFASGISQRRVALILSLNRKTVVRKFLFIGARAALKLEKTNRQHPKASVIEFDDLETFEHTKCKPLSVTLAVESGSRRILGFEVSRMPANGKLAAIARKKYGFRPDERPKGRRRLLKRVRELVVPKALVKSDQNPHYPPLVKLCLPQAEHQTIKGRRGCITGQGELKKIGFDPIFSLNHTCAMKRANINRLFRKTWCTSKKPERLAVHLAIYAEYHNLTLLKR